MVTQQKIANGQLDVCITVSLLDYPYFKTNYKLIEIDLSMQKYLAAYPKATHKINFLGNWDQVVNTKMLFINVKEIKKPLNIQTLLAFLQGTVRILFFFFFGLTIISISHGVMPEIYLDYKFRWS